MHTADELEPLIAQTAAALRGMWTARPTHATGLVVSVSPSGARYVYARYLVRGEPPLPPDELRSVSADDLARCRRGATIDPWLAATASDPRDTFAAVVAPLAAYMERVRTRAGARAPVESALRRLREEGVFDAPGQPSALLAIWYGQRRDQALDACNRALNPTLGEGK